MFKFNLAVVAAIVTACSVVTLATAKGAPQRNAVAKKAAATKVNTNSRKTAKGTKKMAPNAKMDPKMKM